MAIAYLTVAMTMIPLGFYLLIQGADKEEYFIRNAGVIIIIIAIILWCVSLRHAKKEHKDEMDKRDEQLKSILNSINKNTDRIIEEMKNDKVKGKFEGAKP